jgi:hypothetical protein
VSLVKKKKDKRAWIQTFLNKFWYYYNRKWMYKGWFLFFVDMQRWKMRQFRYYLSHIYYYKVKLRFRRIKSKILGGFFTFFIYTNYCLVRFFSNLRLGVSFLNSIQMYCFDFVKVKFFDIYNRLSFFIKTKQYNNIKKKKKK